MNLSTARPDPVLSDRPPALAHLRRTSRLVAFAGIGAAVALTGLAAAPGAGAATARAAATVAAGTDYTSEVDPFMSTQGDHGQNIPGAEVPHGLAKVNPMTYPGRTHAGYDYAQSQIEGFTLTNLDGVGGSGAGGDFLVVPTYTAYTARPTAASYAKTFSHDNETAKPGYYQAGLTDSSNNTINAEMTATVRSGLERYTFPKAGAASLVVDLANNFTSRVGSDLDVTTLPDGRAEITGDVAGYFNGYNYKLYFDSVTNVPVTGVQTWGNGTGLTKATSRSGTDTGAVLNFDVAAGEQVQLTTTLSPISVAQAKTDQVAELGTGDDQLTFDQVEADAHQSWQDTLAKVAVSSDATADPDGSTEGIFYTSLYRMLATPMNATSTSGTYRGVDGKVHHADGYIHYDGFGTWDDFRKYSILAYLYPDVYDDMAQSLVDLYDDDANAGNVALSNLVMSVPTVRFERSAIVIADAISKGVHLDGLSQAYRAIIANTTNYGPTNSSIGYIANDPGTTVAASYDDYALSVIAKAIGKTADASAYLVRSGNYANMIEPGAWKADDNTPVGVLQTRDANGAWGTAGLEDFQAANLYQGTLWQFNWYPSQDMAGLIKAMGGTAAAKDALSHYFGEEAPDDGTKMLKSNANEVDLQTPYLFNYVGEPSKTQKWVRDLYTKETWQNYIATGQTDGNSPPSSNGHLTPPIKEKVFKLDPEGFLPTMDDDTGAMSATYVAAAVGLYPVTAGSSQYQVGSPFFPSVTIAHADGSRFSVNADGVSPDDYYIQSATLNGKADDNTWVDYSTMVGNGSFDATMGAKASDWGVNGAEAFSVSTAADAPATATISADTTTLQADPSGKVDGDLTLTLAGATFAGATGDELVGKDQATVVGLGSGMSATVTRTSDTTVDVHVSGTLTTIAKTRFAVQFADTAFTGVTADQVRGTGLTLADPFHILVTGHWRAALKADYDEARLIVAGNYSAETYAKLASARDAARTVLADATADDARINDADSNVTSALAGLALSQGGFTKMQAIDHDSWSQSTTPDLHNETSNIGGTRPGSWIGFDGITFGGETPDQIQISYSGASNDGYANAAVEVRVGSPTGTLIATVKTPPTAATFGTYDTATADLTSAGITLLSNGTPQSVYFVFTGSNADATDTAAHWVGNVAWMQFVDSTAPVSANNNVVLTPDARNSWGGDGVSVGSNTMKTETDTGTAGSFTAIANTHNGDWVKWTGVDFTKQPVTGLSVHYINNSSRVAADAGMDVYLDSMTGTKLAEVPLPATGSSWSADGTATVTLPSSVTGKHDVYIVLHGTYASATPYIGNIGNLTFTAPADDSDGVKIVAADADAAGQADGTPDSLADSTGLKIETCACDSTVKDVGGTYDGAWLEYDDVSFNKTVTSVAVRYVNNSSRDGLNSHVDFYLDSMDGTPIAAVPLPYTGSGWSPDGTTTFTLPTTITGEHTVYAVMHTTAANANYVSNFISFAFNYGVDKTGLKSLYDAEKPLLAEGARYVTEDFDLFTQAMTTAGSVLADDTAVGSDVATARRTLQLASGQLDPRSKRELMAAVGDAEAITDTSVYTESSAAALAEELDAARATLADTSATDDEQSAEADKLETAISGLALIPRAVPSAPQAVSASVDGTSVTVQWAAPADDGHSPVTGYRVELEGQSPAELGAGTTSYTFDGLKPGHSYRARVFAINAVGTSPGSDYTAYVSTPAHAPAAPVAPTAAVNSAAVTLSWKAPDDGGSTITGYLVKLGDGAPVAVPATATSHTFTGLAPGSYTGTVAAVNAEGTSAYSAASVAVTVAQQPKIVSASASATGGTEVKVGWRMAAGADPVVLEITLRTGGREVASTQSWSSSGSVSFGGLKPGTTYQASVVILHADPRTAATATARTTGRATAAKAVHAHAVAVKGKPRVGRKLRVKVFAGSWSRGTHFSYVWMANGKKVGTGAVLKLKRKLAGKRITVRVTGTIAGWTPASVTSKAVHVRR